ncbi:unnamed protein product [Phyllotreta striolata]|uniref:Protein sleepless n=1 Tax=Phyllotreta striolata TaxID=444603 RepID=A0A9N9TSS8_PHYSR|nr:unnamed protein product [Phyllotreta striolata]
MSFGQYLAFTCAVVVSVLHTGASLECYTCNATFVTERGDDACKNLQTVTKCTDPAVCLSAVLVIEDAAGKKYNEIKSCNIQQGGKECELFLKNMQNMYPATKMSLYKNKCSVCDKEKCNENSKASTAFVPSLLAFAVSFVLYKLI